MKLKKNIKFKDGNQVFRILVSGNDKLVIETRDTESKEAFYHVMDLNTGKKVFRDFQLDEKFWVGIEKIVDDTILFHKYAKPDMPGHSGIIAVSINEKKILWQDDNAEFIAARNDRIYCSRKSFGFTEFIALNISTGEELEKLGRDEKIAERLKAEADSSEDYSDYIFPEKFNAESADKTVESTILGYIKNLDITGDIEYSVAGDLLITNFHYLSDNQAITNRLIAFDNSTQKELLNIVLIQNAAMFVPDSFFIYKNSLILIKEKKEVFTYKIVT
jgi:hypothetical protein